MSSAEILIALVMTAGGCWVFLVCAYQIFLRRDGLASVVDLARRPLRFLSFLLLFFGMGVFFLALLASMFGFQPLIAGYPVFLWAIGAALVGLLVGYIAISGQK